MGGPYQSTVLAASALVKTGPGVVYAVTLTGGSDAASVILYDNTTGSGTQVWATVKAAAGATVHVDLPGGVVFGTGCYATITGTTPSIAVSWR